MVVGGSNNISNITTTNIPKRTDIAISSNFWEFIILYIYYKLSFYNFVWTLYSLLIISVTHPTIIFICGVFGVF